jgi:hypothetical protein
MLETLREDFARLPQLLALGAPPQPPPGGLDDPPPAVELDDRPPGGELDSERGLEDSPPQPRAAVEGEAPTPDQLGLF